MLYRFTTTHTHIYHLSFCGPDSSSPLFKVSYKVAMKVAAKAWVSPEELTRGGSTSSACGCLLNPSLQGCWIEVLSPNWLLAAGSL